MNTYFLIGLIGGIFIILCAVFVIGACMRSAQCSRADDMAKLDDMAAWAETRKSDAEFEKGLKKALKGGEHAQGSLFTRHK